jgi:hypothetical protein
MTSVLWLRWILVAIGVVVGVLLLTHHHVLFGILLLAMAGVRAAIVVALGRRRGWRRAAWQARRPGRFGPPS